MMVELHKCQEDILADPEPEKAKTILDEASEVVYGPRNRAYGHPKDNHQCTADLFRAYINRKYDSDVPFTAEDVCWFHILEKASREANMPVRDNIVDVAGYAANIEMIRRRRGDTV